MATTISMPQLGETVTEGTILEWVKQIGEHVAEDEVIVDGSTELRVISSHFDLELPGKPTDTVSLWILKQAKVIPAVGENFFIDGLEVSIHEASSRRIEKCARAMSWKCEMNTVLTRPPPTAPTTGMACAMAFCVTTTPNRAASARTCAAADRTGHAILHALYQQNISARTHFFDEFFAIDLIKDHEGYILGALALEIETGEPILIEAFEGIDGSGKSTQARRLAARLGFPHHVVDVALFHAGAGDADELRLAAHLLDVAAAGVAHRGTHAADQLMHDRRKAALVGYAPLDTLGHQLVLLGVFLEVAIARALLARHRPQRSHAPVGLIGPALEQQNLARAFIGTGEQ